MSIHIDEKEKFLLGNLNGQAIAATNVFYTRNLQADVYGGDTEEKEYDGINAGQDVPQTRLNETNSFGFDLDYVASGALGTAPNASIWLQAAGFKETINAGVDVVYTKEAINAIKSVDMDMRRVVEQGGTRDYLYQTLDAKGQAGISLSNGNSPVFNFANFAGDYVRPSDVTGVTPDYGTQKDNLALPANADNTLAVILGSESICISEFACQNLTGYTASRLTLPGGCKYTKMSSGVVEASVTMLANDWTSEFNLFAYAETGAGIQRFPFSMTHGTVAGQILELASTEVQVLPGVSETEIEGELAFSCTLRALQPFVLTAK